MVRQHNRGDERKPAAGRGLSYIAHEGKRFLMKEAVAEAGVRMIGKAMWNKYKRWPVYSKFFDNLGPIPHHMHQQHKHAKLTGQEGKPEAYYFSPQMNNCDNHFPYTFMGLEPGTTKADIRRCLENWNKGDNGILYLTRAYRLMRGSGWLIPAGVLHAPGSLCTYEPQWGSDVSACSRTSSRAVRTLGPAGQGCTQGQAPGPGLHRRAARLGEERRYAFHGKQPAHPHRG